MEHFADLKHQTAGMWPAHGLSAGLRHAWREVDVNWYQVAVVAVSTFAISMDLMFPPIRVAIRQGLDIYAGHAFMPPLASAAVQVDFGWLAFELLMIVALAVAAWRIGTTASDERDTHGTE